MTSISVMFSYTRSNWETLRLAWRSRSNVILTRMASHRPEIPRRWMGEVQLVATAAAAREEKERMAVEKAREAAKAAKTAAKARVKTAAKVRVKTAAKAKVKTVAKAKVKTAAKAKAKMAEARVSHGMEEVKMEEVKASMCQ